MAYLYKHTELQSTFPCNLTCLVPEVVKGGEERTRPRRLGLKEGTVWSRLAGQGQVMWGAHRGRSRMSFS